MPRERKPRRKTTRKLNILRLSLVVGIFITLVFTGSALGFVMYSVQDMPAWDPAALEPNLPTYILDKDGNEIARIYVENRDLVEIKEIPENVQNAFLAIEDIRFYQHRGLDLKRIAGALVADIKAGRAAQGASTITQQLVKRAFLTPEKKLERKIQEAALAIQLERKYTKDQILEMYLNQIYFGKGAYGIKSAARIYFGKDVDKLTLQEAALLAGLPKAPSYYDPYKNPEAAVKRRNIVIENMARYDIITREEADTAKAAELKLSGTKDEVSAKYKYPYFVDYVTDILLDRYGEDKVYKGGLEVHTTLDPEIQTFAEEAMADPKNFPKSKPDKNGIDQPQAAAVVLDPHTGYIKAIVGGRDHKQKRQFNRATDALRQPGSAFKPIVAYGPAVENGAAPATVLKDEPFKIGSKEFKNYDDKFHGLVTYRTSVLKSHNIPALKVLQEIGVEKGIKFAEKLGITSLVDRDDDPKRNDENLSLALGGITKGVSPLDLAGAYGAFANEGVFVESVAITKVKDRNGNLLDQHKPQKTIAMKKTTAYMVTSILQSVVTSGTGTGASLSSRPVAGKTGTTSDDKDAWFAGFTPELVTVVWMGHDEPTKMNGVYGGKYPARIWRQIMSKALKDTPVKEFPQPEGIVWGTVCSKSGNLPSDECPEEHLVKDIFAKGTLPKEVCDIHIPVEVCTESNQIPTEYCPDRTVRSFVEGEEPTEACTLHNSNTQSYRTPVCDDPRHGGILYAAIVAGPDRQGGCPPESVRYIDFPSGQAPTAYCYISEHQLQPRVPANPNSPDRSPPSSPRVQKPKKPTD